MNVPSSELLTAWNTGLTIDDEQLAELVTFFTEMEQNCNAMGPAYELAVRAFRGELLLAQIMQDGRKEHSAWLTRNHGGK